MDIMSIFVVVISILCLFGWNVCSNSPSDSPWKWSPTRSNSPVSTERRTVSRLPPDPKQVQVIKFKVAGATKKRYKKFLYNLRSQLADRSIPSPKNHPEALVLPNCSSFTRKSEEHKRMLLVCLSNSSQKPCVDLILDRVDAYILGYRVGDRYYLLDLDGHHKEVYGFMTDSHQKTVNLELGSNYGDLESMAKSRCDLELGILQLQKAITTLRETDTTNDGYKESVAEALLVCIQMISEPARLACMEEKICETIIETEVQYKSFKPDDTMLELEKNWVKLSTAVHTSNYKWVKEKFGERSVDFIKQVKLVKSEGNVSNEAGKSQQQGKSSSEGRSRKPPQQRGKSSSVGRSGVPTQLSKNTKGKKKA